MKTLIAGWFSFEQMGATAGDLLARDVALEWLGEAGRVCEVALAPPFEGGVDWRAIDPSEYSHVVFVCGPFGNGWPVTDFLEKFRGRMLLGLNLTMLEPLEIWNPFDLLLERDSSRTARPEMAFASTQPIVPVVGIVLVHSQMEYKGGVHQLANQAIARLRAARSMAAVEIDTRLDKNDTDLRTPAEVESLIARMDVVLTTRLHGMTLALKNGVPAIAIDPIAGGAKVRRQAQTINWPVCFTADRLDYRELDQAFSWCLSEEARACALECRDRARRTLNEIREQFVAALATKERV
jgi:Polysaccharide pyruvyl transferase